LFMLAPFIMYYNTSNNESILELTQSNRKNNDVQNSKTTV